MRSFTIRGFVCGLACFTVLAVNANASRRALVIGNDSYPGNSLRNARNDAKGVAAALKQVGYTTTLVLDADRREFIRAVDVYTNSIEVGDAAVIYYAGHGMQVNGENFLIPTDFRLTAQTDPKVSAYSLTALLETVSRHGAATEIVILDACRNNPFRGDRSYGGGWASLGTSAGTFLAFGTSPGSTASDDPSSTHGLFTKSLLQHLTKSPLDIEQMFQQVRLQVIRESQGQQIPWTASSLVGSFHILPEEDAGAKQLAELDGLERNVLLPKAQSARTFLSDLKSQKRSEEHADDLQAPTTLRTASLSLPNMDTSSDPEASVRSAADLVRGGKLDLALQVLQTAATFTPTGSVLRLLGIILQLAHRNTESAAVLSRALQLNPDDVSALTYRCLALAESVPSTAIQDCEAALRLSPSSAEAHLALSNLLHGQGQDQRAYNEAERAIASAPQSALGFALRGRIASSQNHEGLARQDYERAVRLAEQQSVQ